jgi:hypothetical protein
MLHARRYPVLRARRLGPYVVNSGPTPLTTRRARISSLGPPAPPGSLVDARLAGPFRSLCSPAAPDLTALKRHVARGSVSLLAGALWAGLGRTYIRRRRREPYFALPPVRHIGAMPNWPLGTNRRRGYGRSLVPPCSRGADIVGSSRRSRIAAPAAPRPGPGLRPPPARVCVSRQGHG